MTEKDGPTYSAEKVWSVRQMAVYHGVRMSKKQATLGTLCSSLIVISAPENIKDVFHRYHDGVDSKNRSLGQCFEIHLLILHELLGTWRPYLRWLTVELANRVCCYLHSHLLLLTFSRLEMPSSLALGSRTERLMHEIRAKS